MIVQGKKETRTRYLLRVAAQYIEDQPCNTIEYDDTTCDGYCLTQELRDEAEATGGDEG